MKALALPAFLTLWVFLPAFSDRLPGADHALEKLKESPPKEASEELKTVLPTDGVRVVDKKKKPIVDIWLRREIPVKDGASGKLRGLQFTRIPEGSFVGLIRFHQKGRDFRDNRIPEGLFTMRFAVLPSDGDHLAVSDTRDFALLAPCSEDKKLDPIPVNNLVKLSARVTGESHPAILCLLDTGEEQSKFPGLYYDEEYEWTVVQFQIPCQGEKNRLRIGVVVIGTAPEF